MLGYIAAFMLITATILSLFANRTQETLTALLTGGTEAVALCIKICGSICFFSGLMKLVEKSGITAVFSRVLRPVVRFLMPSSSISAEAEQAVTMNIASNALGLGNAATPMGIKAVNLMFTQNKLSAPDRSVAAFVVLNTSSVTLIPSTVASLLAAGGAPEPFALTPVIFLVQTLSAAVGLIAVFILYRRRTRK